MRTYVPPLLVARFGLIVVHSALSFLERAQTGLYAFLERVRECCVKFDSGLSSGYAVSSSPQLLRFQQPVLSPPCCAAAGNGSATAIPHSSYQYRIQQRHDALFDGEESCTSARNCTSLFRRSIVLVEWMFNRCVSGRRSMSARLLRLVHHLCD